MKRITLIALFACGLLATSTPALAQTPDSSWLMGNINLLLLGRDDVASSKFEEYRTVPQGISMPSFSLAGNQKNVDFALYGQKVALDDQHYMGWMKTNWLGVAFDYNQIVHNMGSDATLIWNETAPGVWSMNATLRETLGNTIQSTSSSTRNYTWYANLYAPQIAAANHLDITSLRQRGNVEFDLGRNLPFDVKVAYFRELKTGYRGAGGGRVDGISTNVLEVPWALDEVTQDLGFRIAYNQKWGNLYAAYHHNWYNNLVERTFVDNPILATDTTYVSSSFQSGAAQPFFVGPPDNSADNTSFGVLLKFARQTRVSADVALGQWVQDAQLYPFTSNSVILITGGPHAGLPASSTAGLDVQSLSGKIATTMYNFAFSSRPFTGFGLRARYRSYEMDNQTPTFVRSGGTGNNPDRSWANAQTITAEAPFGYATANPYGGKNSRFDLQASYDIHDLTFEAAYHNAEITRTYREATKGAEDGWSIAAVLHSNHWLLFRGLYDWNHRTASGYDAATSNGLQADESERETNRVGFDVELSPNDMVVLIGSYFRHKDDYPNRPNRVSGVDGTSNGLLSANYDTYTVEVDVTPGERYDLGAYYTYETNRSTTRYGTSLTGNGILTFEGSDKTNTYGLWARIGLTPETWAFNVNARRQKLDGLMDVTADPASTFALARAAYGGVGDITDYNDTDLQTVMLSFDYNFSKSAGVNFGYAYEKYSFADAYSTPNSDIYPLTGSFYLKANDNGYSVNVVYVKLNYHW